jgi:hypothetical protein
MVECKNAKIKIHFQGQVVKVAPLAGVCIIRRFGFFYFMQIEVAVNAAVQKKKIRANRKFLYKFASA